MKKYLIIILLLMLCLSLGSCKKTNETKTKNTSTTISTNENKISDNETEQSLSGDKTNEQVAIELLNDEYADNIKLSKGIDPHEPTDEDWTRFENRSEKLELGEKVEEYFQSDDTYSLGFYPSFGVRHGGTFYYSSDSEYQVFSGKRALVMHCDGFESGGNFDKITFKGPGMIKDAAYKLTITVKAVTTGKSFWVFLTTSGEDCTEILKIPCTNKGEIITKEVTFVAKSNNQFIGLEVEQCNDGDEIAVGYLSLERIDASPVVKNASISRDNRKFTASYTYFDCEGDKQTGTNYDWFASVDKNGLGKIKLDKHTETIELSENELKQLAGYSIGCEITAVNSGNNGNNGSKTVAYAPGTIEGEIVTELDENLDEDGSVLELYNVGDYYIENFAAIPYGVTIDASWGSLTGMSIASNMLSINGYTVFMNYSDASSRPALIIHGLKYATNATYKMTFDIKIITEAKPTIVCAEFQYSSVGLMSNYLSNFESEDGVYHCEFTFTTPSEVSSQSRPIVYLDNISGCSEEVTWALDNFKIELINK